MTIAELLDRLGYQKSENYLREDRGDFYRVVDYGHLFRKAAQDPCHLRGVYALNGPGPAVPVVYVCDVTSEEAARKAHRLVWNQDTVPFLIVNSPQSVRVYPGFCRETLGSASASVRAVQGEFGKADINKIATTLNATAVDSGETWRAWGRFIRPEHRVDWSLLDNLRKLDAWLQHGGGLARDVSHALIGKYVYLYYLRHRDILSDRKLERWQIDSNAVFGRNATADGLQSLLAKLDDWLNGEVFPLDFRKRGAPANNHVAHVAATFEGDEPIGSDGWQLHLDFKAYDFSYIPIEILSIVYEQFLNAPGKDGAKNRRRSTGAYYTPIPVVNFMLSELEDRWPLKRGMRVFDPACGSGAFLVQAFRRLIEKEFPPADTRPSPSELRDLLEAHFVGLDTDEDACSVTRLSLILTLLDYVRPPDLEIEGRPGPKPGLPTLRDNIFCGNFFDDAGDWQRVFARKKADWVVGNPPWKQLKRGNVRKEDEPVLAWIRAEEKHRPVGNRQTARAFAWRAAEYADENGEIALFLPAMTLFEEAAKGFRRQFLQKMKVHTIANFSNLRWVISAGRFTAPAAAFFYRPRLNQKERVEEDESIRTYSPLVANQEATRPVAKEKRNESWSIVINASEIRDIPLLSVADGQALPWKLAFWGSHLDAKLLLSLRRRFKTIGEMEKKNLITIAQGLELRPADATEGVEPISLPASTRTTDVSKLEGMRAFFALPDWVMVPVPADHTHCRKGRAEGPLSVCHPPHVLVNAARNFAVYSEQFFIVPPRQIGISSPNDNKDFLKALSLFLNSDFAFYFEFFTSTQFGVERNVSTLKALRKIPTPLHGMSASELKAWARVHDSLAKATREAYQSQRLRENDGDEEAPPCRAVLGGAAIAEVNGLVYDALGLAPQERTLVHDMVRVRLALNNGKLGKEAVGRPAKSDMLAYGLSLKEELDDYICGEIPGTHDVQIVHDDHSGMVCVTLVRKATGRGRVSVLRAGVSEATSLEECRQRIRQKKSQWVYFDRNLRVYDGDNTYILKPMQMFHWTQSQARVDAMEIVPESMARRDET